MSAAPECPPSVFIPERARGPRSGRSYRAARGRSASSLLALPVVQPDPAGEKVTTAFLPQSADQRLDNWGATSWHVLSRVNVSIQLPPGRRKLSVAGFGLLGAE